MSNYAIHSFNPEICCHFFERTKRCPNLQQIFCIMFSGPHEVNNSLNNSHMVYLKVGAQENPPGQIGCRISASFLGDCIWFSLDHASSLWFVQLPDCLRHRRLYTFHPEQPNMSSSLFCFVFFPC